MISDGMTIPESSVSKASAPADQRGDDRCDEVRVLGGKGLEVAAGPEAREAQEGECCGQDPRPVRRGQDAEVGLGLARDDRPQLGDPALARRLPARVRDASARHRPAGRSPRRRPAPPPMSATIDQDALDADPRPFMSVHAHANPASAHTATPTLAPRNGAAATPTTTTPSTGRPHLRPSTRSATRATGRRAAPPPTIDAPKSNAAASLPIP